MLAQLYYTLSASCMNVSSAVLYTLCKLYVSWLSCIIHSLQDASTLSQLYYTFSANFMYVGSAVLYTLCKGHEHWLSCIIHSLQGAWMLAQLYYTLSASFLYVGSAELYILDADYRLCITCITQQQLWGYKVEENLYLGYAPINFWCQLGLGPTGTNWKPVAPLHHSICLAE
jgi:hypothetical protein